MERNVRTNMAVCGHSLSYDLRLLEMLRREHTTILDILKERGLELLPDSLQKWFVTQPSLVFAAHSQLDGLRIIQTTQLTL